MPFPVIVLVLLFQVTQQQPETNQRQQNVSAASPGVTIPQGKGSVEENTAAHHDEQTNSYDPMKDLLYRLYLKATIIGVIGGFFGIVILVWQTVLTRKSANAARDAAIAANDSAKALRNIERPWIIVCEARLDTVSFKPDDDPEGGKEPHHCVYWKFRNFGKTPAFIKHVQGGIGIIEAHDKYAVGYDIPHSYAPEPILAPDAVSEQMKFISDQTIGPEGSSGQLSKISSSLILRGIIEYADPLGGQHHSRFLYVYDRHSQSFKVRWGVPNSSENEYT